MSARHRCRLPTISSRSAAQTIQNEHPKEEDLRRAFSDLLLTEETLALLGPAINSGRGLFVYGDSGNGKSSIAERISRCFDSTVWVPHVILVEGQLLKLFDMANHEPVETERSSGLLDETDHDRGGFRSSARPSSAAASCGWTTSRFTTTRSPRSARRLFR